MKKSLAALAAIAGLSMSAGLGATQVQRAIQPAPPRRRTTAQRGGGSPYGKYRGNRRYPEQSSRQAQRGMRRAQGGPGLVLKGGEYHPRTGYPEASDC